MHVYKTYLQQKDLIYKFLFSTPCFYHTIVLRPKKDNMEKTAGKTLLVYNIKHLHPTVSIYQS